jgi:hypothetical protein
MVLCLVPGEWPREKYLRVLAEEIEYPTRKGRW